MNAYGHEIFPSPNPDYISGIAAKDVLVYSCGSLWTRCGAPYPTISLLCKLKSFVQSNPLLSAARRSALDRSIAFAPR